MTANLNARLGVTLSYTNEEGGTSTMTAIALAAQYQSQSHGTIDVPDTTAADTEFSIPFGAVDEAATLVVIENRTGQSCEVKINGQNPVNNHHDLAAGGVYVFGAPHAPDANPMLSVKLKLNATQAGAGLIAYRIFGDPV